MDVNISNILLISNSIISHSGIKNVINGNSVPSILYTPSEKNKGIKNCEGRNTKSHNKITNIDQGFTLMLVIKKKAGLAALFTTLDLLYF